MGEDYDYLGGADFGAYQLAGVDHHLRRTAYGGRAERHIPETVQQKNVKGSASVSLYISSAFMQIVVLLVYFSNDAWLAMLAISTLTVLPAYLMTTAYLFKLCISGEYASYTTNHSRSAALVSSIIGFVFCLFMFYASEIKYLAMVPVLLTLGVPLFIWARKKTIAQIKYLRYANWHFYFTAGPRHHCFYSTAL